MHQFPNITKILHEKFYIELRLKYKKQELITPSQAPEFTPGFLLVSVLLIF